MQSDHVLGQNRHVGKFADRKRLSICGDNGFWAGFVPGLKDGDLYRFYVVGTGSEGFKRDPYARELEFNGYPDCNCIVRDPDNYSWINPVFIFLFGKLS